MTSWAAAGGGFVSCGVAGACVGANVGVGVDGFGAGDAVTPAIAVAAGVCVGAGVELGDGGGVGDGVAVTVAAPAEADGGEAWAADTVATAEVDLLI